MYLSTLELTTSYIDNNIDTNRIKTGSGELNFNLTEDVENLSKIKQPNIRRNHKVGWDL